jgi:cytochrome c
MTRRIFFCAAAGSLVLYSFINVKSQGENHPPVVKILSPENNSSFSRDAALTYRISVSDQEDGDSKYDEINTREVLLEVRHLRNKKAGKTDPAGLAIIMRSNCVSCHNFNSKAMGPSFCEIAGRYAASRANRDTLMKRIRLGSTGIWGKEKMPAHNELSAAETKSIADWILKDANDPNVNYYIGTEGYFRIGQTAGAGSRDIYQLTASYTDHGLKDAAAKRLRSQDVVTIYTQ